MITVHLHKMKFFAHHGWHDEEGVAGTEFEVSVSVSLMGNEPISALHETVDYIKVYDIVKEKFLHPTRLLETLAQEITEEIYKIHVAIASINITITKLNPPITNFTGTAGINYTKTFSP